MLSLRQGVLLETQGGAGRNDASDEPSYGQGVDGAGTGEGGLAMNIVLEKPALVLKAEGNFTPERTLDDLPGVGTVYIGRDLRLYRKTNGLLSLIAPCEPVKDSKEEVWIDKVDWGEFPPMGQVKYLWKNFFLQYKKEVMVLIGRKWDETGWFFMVPKQRGGFAEIQWEDKEGTEWFSRFGRYIGSIHVHPRNSAGPSGTDLGWWRKRDASGLHMVLGRGGAWTITGSSAGHAVQLLEAEDGALDKIEEEKALLIASLNRKLSELLLDVPPIPIFKNKGKKGWAWTPPVRQAYKGGSRTQYPQFQPEPRTAEQQEVDFSVGACQDAISSTGGMFVEETDVDCLRVLIMDDGTHAIVTERQAVQVALALAEWGVQFPRSMPVTRFVGNQEGGDDGLYTGEGKAGGSNHGGHDQISEVP